MTLFADHCGAFKTSEQAMRYASGCALVFIVAASNPKIS
jgi:hypothetical protein